MASITDSSSLIINLKLSTRPRPPITMSSTSSKPSTTIYFGYGSNLWLHQMRQRCPTSKYLGIARLKGYKWIIYDRGYANIVEIEEEEKEALDKHDYTAEVWGLVYNLEKEDEKRLDVNESVPIGYTKEWIECELWRQTTKSDLETHDDGSDSVSFTWPNDTVIKPNPSTEPDKVDMLVYINRDLRKESDPKEEYIYRMNMGIKDAVQEGVPKEYVKQVMRRFIPDVEEVDERVREVARQQAVEFKEEGER